MTAEPGPNIARPTQWQITRSVGLAWPLYEVLATPAGLYAELIRRFRQYGAGPEHLSMEGVKPSESHVTVLLPHIGASARVTLTGLEVHVFSNAVPHQRLGLADELFYQLTGAILELREDSVLGQQAVAGTGRLRLSEPREPARLLRRVVSAPPGATHRGLRYYGIEPDQFHFEIALEESLADDSELFVQARVHTGWPLDRFDLTTAVALEWLKRQLQHIDVQLFVQD